MRATLAGWKRYDTETYVKKGQSPSARRILSGRIRDFMRPIHTGMEKYIKNTTLEGKPRKRQVKKERKNSMLPTTEDKLLFSSLLGLPLRRACVL